VAAAAAASSLGAWSGGIGVKERKK
jgi:hypothetical protein